MPLIPIALAALGGAWAWNKIDDDYIDPFTGISNRPIISGTALAFLVGGGALLLLAKRKGVI